ncbi:hypothetical protein [Glycomyces artemisiae]|uniref:Uncharacterized protein n=1 Tax=Glycomyces artemisiae TaxID=1076443 RepID=A0A2T0UEU0_9ACTN|nr:hypothetical protein [Glycomyces artemisiae]PRY56461.1 hypothetical protein B0I28_109110 [Glycomyces artemisiae]
MDTTDPQPDPTTRILWVPSLADPTNPTPAELAAGSELHLLPPDQRDTITGRMVEVDLATFLGTTRRPRRLPRWLRDLVWVLPTAGMGEEFRGWRHPLWRGSDDWPGDDEDRYWRRTIVVRIPGRRYMVVTVPIRRRYRREGS